MRSDIENHPEITELPPSSLEDRELTLAFQAGEKGAYQAIFERHSPRVSNVCRRMLPNAQDSQDAVQETFLRVYQALGRFNGRYQLGAWITRIATNVCLDHLRAKSRRPTSAVSLDEVELDLQDEVEIERPDEVVIRRSESRRVRKILNGLPPMHRAAIVLRDFEGLSYEEVAVALGITECQVKALIHRARKGFKRSWSSLGASIFIPARWFGRVRKVDAPHKEQANHTMSSAQQLAESLTASAAPAATSCTSAMAHCGQFVTERIAPALAAMAVGAASLAGPVAARDSQGTVEASSAVVEEHGVLSSAVVSPKVKPSKVTRTVRTHRNDPAPAETRTDDEPEPSTPPPVTPSPSPSASSPPATGSGQGSTEPSNPAPSPKPSPPPLAASVGFAEAGPATVPSSNKTTVGCLTRTIEQSLVTRVWTDTGAYDGSLYLKVSGGVARIEVSVVKDGKRYTYASWGEQPTAAWTEGSKTTDVAVTGRFGPAHGTDPESAGLAVSGTFEARLGVNCDAASITSESVVFTGE